MSDHADRFTAVLDTNVLVGALVRNIILTFAEAGFFRPRWSHQTIEVEFGRAFRNATGPELHGQADVQRGRISRAFPEGVVVVHDALMKSVRLPDPDDTHVLAAAIQIRASVIVTDNLADFPEATLAPFELEALSADDFIADCLDMAGPDAVAALRRMRQRFQDPAMDAEALIRRMEQVGLAKSATFLESFKTLL